MKFTFVRGFLLFAVAATMFIRISTLRALDSIPALTVAEDATAIIKAKGFGVLENPHREWPKSRIIYFQRPECRQPSSVLPFYINAEMMLYLAQLVDAGADRRFVFLGKTWANADRFAMYFEWGKKIVLDAYLSPSYFFDTTFRTVLLVAEPAGCAGNFSVDWGKVWDRNRSSAAAVRAPL